MNNIDYLSMNNNERNLFESSIYYALFYKGDNRGDENREFQAVYPHIVDNSNNYIDSFTTSGLVSIAHKYDGRFTSTGGNLAKINL